MNHSKIKKIAKYTLGGILITAGIGHLTFARKEFQAQVPDWTPLKKDDTVVYSGLVEIALGTSLIISEKHAETKVGKIAAGFFAAVFPGNISQYLNRKDAFGLDSDNKRLARLFMQPLLMAWAIKATDNK
ncbi:DoxX family protein [Moheibacter sediminis]|uniref:Uncharacterized membrane protein n=1 Tax=Moheibacter sediminis TaxID=1434700 RepID=A0A1W2BV37_9FLAO|nr:hypothetical protein [Moheibacter sediminis]SMC76865.1 Uncharacterized membrane protein [Moheibacter sediminis]